MAIAATAAATALRFYHLGARSFWYDEALSIGFARLPAGQFLRILWEREINMALYYALLRPWLYLGGSEAVVRALSAVAGVLTVAAVYAVGRRLFDSETGATAALLLAFNAFAIRYSQEARAYALVALLVTVATLLLLKAVQERSRTAWTWYAICAAAAVYAHLFAVLVLAAHAIWLLLRRDEIDRSEAARAGKLLVLLLLPIAAVSLHAGPAPIQWVRPTSWATVRDFFLELCGNSRVAAIAFVVLWIVGIVRKPRDAAAVCLWLFLPIATVLAVSLVRPIFVARYLMICTPAAALATAVGVRSIPNRCARSAVGIAIITITAVAARTAYSDPMGSVPQDYRAATAYLLREARPGDALFFYPAPTRAAYEAYRRNQPGPEVIFPAHPAGSEYLDLISQPLAEVLPDIPMTRPRVFLVISSFPPATRDLGADVVRAWVAHRYRLQNTAPFTNIDVLTFSH